MKTSGLRRCAALRRAACLGLLACLCSAAPAGAGPTPGVRDGDSAPAAPGTATKPRRLYAGLVFGGGGMTDRDGDGFGTLGLSLGGYPRPRVRVDGTATFGGFAFLADSAAGRAFKDAEAADVGLEVTARYDPPRYYARLRFYPLVGAGVGTMFWDYTTPVTVTREGKPQAVGYDGIFYGTLFGGGGASLQVTRNFALGGSLVGGVRHYDRSMGSGARNELLRSTGFVRLLFEANWQVR